MEQHVDMRHLLDERRDLRFVGDVGFDERHDVALGLRELRLQCRFLAFIDVGERHASVAADHGFRDRRTECSGSAGDQGRFS